MNKILQQTVTLSTFLTLPLFVASCDGGGDSSSNNLTGASNELVVGDQITTTLQDDLGTVTLRVTSADRLTYNYNSDEGVSMSGNVPFTYSNNGTPEVRSIINTNVNQTVGLLNTELSNQGSSVAAFYAANDTGTGASHWDDQLRWQFVQEVNQTHPDAHMVLYDSRFYLLTEGSVTDEGSGAMMNLQGVRVSPFRTGQGTFSFLLFADQTFNQNYGATVAYQ